VLVAVRRVSVWHESLREQQVPQQQPLKSQATNTKIAQLTTVLTAQLQPQLRLYENRKGQPSSESIPDKLPFLINDYRHFVGILIPELRAWESWRDDSGWSACGDGKDGLIGFCLSTAAEPIRHQMTCMCQSTIIPVIASEKRMANRSTADLIECPLVSEPTR
jgi:hypothetical protein